MAESGSRTHVNFASQSRATVAPVKESVDNAAGRIQHQGMEASMAKVL